MAGRGFKAYRRYATPTDRTLLMAYLASRQHFLSSAVSHFLHVSFSLVTLRFRRLAWPLLLVSFLFVHLFLPAFFSFLPWHYIALSLTFASCFLPSVSFLSFFLSPSISLFLPLLNWCLFVCLPSDQRRRRRTLPGLGTPVVQWRHERLRRRFSDSQVMTSEL